MKVVGFLTAKIIISESVLVEIASVWVLMITYEVIASIELAVMMTIIIYHSYPFYYLCYYFLYYLSLTIIPSYSETSPPPSSSETPTSP